MDLPYPITDGITLQPAPGHTAGHLVVEVTGLLNWDGKGRPPGLFPPPRPTESGPGELDARTEAEPERQAGAPTSEDK